MGIVLVFLLYWASRVEWGGGKWAGKMEKDLEMSKFE
jgi:hypothetical protein